MVSDPFAHTLRVRYAECDPQGVVFNANYLAYMDIGITELWRAAFGGYQVMLDRGIDLVVVQTELRFYTPARFDDLLRLEVHVTRMGTTSISTTHRLLKIAGPSDASTEVGDSELVLDGSIHHVVVDRDALSKTAIPDWVRAALEPWAGPTSDQASDRLSPGQTPNR